MFESVGELLEIFLDGDKTAGRILCQPRLIPAPGQYLLADSVFGSDSPLPVPVFPTDSTADGFITAPALPADWSPGTRLRLRGPLGRGFSLPRTARRIVLAALGETPARVLALLPPALRQDASLALLCDTPPPELPAEIEIRPLSALPEARIWADYLALDLPRAALPALRARLGLAPEAPAPANVQALVTTPVPCGGLGECGVCALKTKRGWKLACKDGPVFDLRDLV
ncbi:MAG: hypothetical protein GXP40_08505 [Chloroflexi bacterium]|nr:hypothetical protein [Chloroflexota bacterium]